MKSKTRQRIVVVVGLVTVVAILVGVKAGQIVTMVHAGESFTPPPQAVTSATVQRAEWEAARAAVGTLVAVQGVTLGAEVPGRVREITFRSGAVVKAGEVLVRLDTSAEDAQLAAAVADAELAKATLTRSRRLRQGEVNAQADLDAAEARAKQADATVANLRAIIAKKTIRAPFEGRISIRQVNLGQILAPGTPIASLQQVSPIHADFWLPQQALRDVEAGERVRLRTDTFPDAAWEGEVSTVNPEVDPATRNVRVRATFRNADGRLRPGMFGNVEVLASQKRPVLTIPATAVMYAPYGDSVYAIEPQQGAAGKPAAVVRQKFVRLGERRGDLVAVVSGLGAGETIVSSGVFKLRNGAAVAVDDTLAPKAQLAPKPTEE
ncbi:efflux RND transporter periplasmic adaptor subunit [Anaeromyxobacter diazotrophicus]|uniref:MexH family multidrug efflux RND transporter periplasmic adaptor subunit n=1 Tax=Anaeromyxobacter diazotrophicus TaxID=2590199 RepID=A0A7I9VGS6_9BACT|nr:efflux RND transporter periplasmic adaptor subunit [Anaeromyxobacter diazotrophicus]GEJ55545.1 MexH family multidrug efflux RND transporter periplasmic adaptor subunit [Anaeromyxobacter diazotrophicus]